jgi:hypothetical protein
MRALPLLGALAVGLTLCGTAAAQSTTNLYQNNYAYSGTSTTLYQQNYSANVPNTSAPPANNSFGKLLQGGFSPRTVFQRFQSPPGRPDFTPMPAIPNPQTDKAAFLRAVGLRRLH